MWGPVEMDNFCLGGPAAFQSQTNAGLDLMEALAAGRSRVEIQHTTQRRHTLNPKDMTVAADEDVGRILAEHGSETGLPSIRVSGNVGHPETDAVQFEPVVNRIPTPNKLPVDISHDGTDRCDGRQLFQDVGITHIPAVQDDITPLQHGAQFGMDPAVGIGNNADQHAAIARSAGSPHGPSCGATPHPREPTA